MKNSILKSFILLLFFVSLSFVQGQTQGKIKEYKQKYFDKNKILEDVYELRNYKNRWTPTDKDTLSYFVDIRNYKGIINYGVEFKSKNYKLFNFTEDVAMHYLNVEFEKCTFNPSDSIIEIQGYISGGWSGKKGWNDTENTIEVFLGNKKDTISYHYFKNVANTNTVETTFKNQIIKDYVVLDSFPSFYFKKYSHYIANSQEKRPFKIKGKINENSTLAFGGRACYSEVFDIGAMVFMPNKNHPKKNKKEDRTGSKRIILKNKRIDDFDNEKVADNEIPYYSYTEKAEDFILRGQYAKAKEEYLLLDKEYPVLFARDIQNAVRCGVLSRDYKNAFYWGEKLAPKGVPIEYFNASVFTVLKRNPSWKNFTVRYDSIYKESLEKFNKNLKTQIEALTEEDQADYGPANRKEPKVLYETTVRVTDKLIELLKNEGYPSEEKIGVYTRNDTILNHSPNYHVLIMHARQQKVENLPVLNELLVQFGKNIEYDYTRNRLKSGINNSCFHIYKGNLYSSKSCGKNDLMVRKMKFMFNNPHNFILYNNEYDVIPYEKEIEKERDEYYKENYNFVIKLTDDWFFYEK